MKTSLIIISALLVLSVFVPFFLFIYNSSKQSSKIKKQVKSITGSNNLNYSQYDIWHKNFIGITNNQSVTYANFKNSTPILVQANFIDIESCNIIKEYAAGKNKKNHLKRLGLELVYKQQTKPHAFFEFFDVDEDVTEDFEMQRIEKWQTLIKQHIATAHNSIKKAS